MKENERSMRDKSKAMTLSIPRSELQRGLGRLQAIVEKRNSMPILANVLVEATAPDSVLFAATDLEVGIRSVHAAAVKTSGAVTIPAKKLFEIIRELPEETVELAVNPQSYVEVACARSRFTLAGTAADEYPTLPEAKPGHLVPVQAVVLSAMIERTMYATSLDETRYNLNGVLFEVQPESGRVRMVATDGHRLACSECTIGPDVAGLSSGVIVPRKALAELKRLVDEQDADEVEIGFEGNSGLARKGDVTLVMRLIEGEFPNYQQVLPKTCAQHLTAPAEDLTRAVRRVALLSAERSRAVKMEFEPGRLVASSSNPDLGQAREELEVEYDGPPLSIGFNARYLLDAFAALGAKEVRIGLNGDLSPIEIRATDDPDVVAVVMPMRI
jgi:DNA polymerase-3 subunit beta